LELLNHMQKIWDSMARELDALGNHPLFF
jgi:hypothetical protein